MAGTWTSTSLDGLANHLFELNPQRLDIARRRRGLTKTGLAREMGVSTRMVTALLAGEKQPSAATLSRLAERLRFAPEFFEGDDLPEPPIDGTSFRALSTMSARKRDVAFGAASIGMALSQWIDARFVLPSPDVPRYQGIDPETAAVSLRVEWGLGERPIRNMIHLLEAHGVRIFSLPEECLDIDAFSLRPDHQPYVFLNTRKSTEHSRMDGAHETGHLVMHWRGAARGREAEYEASQFASAFLMPAGSVLSQVPRGASLREIIAAKHTWGVSAAALTYRMHNLGMLTDWQYRTLFKELSRRGYRTNEPQGMKAETSQVLAKVFTALRAEGRPKANVAHELQISEADLNEIVFGLVLIPVSAWNGTHAAPAEALDRPPPTLRVL